VTRDTSKPSLKTVKPDDKGGGKPSPQDRLANGDKSTGRVTFDDRGNAIWEWAVTTGAFSADITTQRLKKLENPTLSLADDAPPPLDTVKANPLGTVKGYNPYDSGKLAKAEVPRKKDLRRLSEWLKLRKQASDNNPDEE
jgi:hypothetical protein